MHSAYPLTSPRRLKAWAALGLVAAALLWLLAWIELPGLGQSLSDADTHPYRMADRVELGVWPWRTFVGGDLHTGPSFTYLLLWGWAGLNALLLWPLRRQFAAARGMFTLYGLTATFLIVAGVLWLPYAASEINALFATGTEAGRSLSAFGPYLGAVQCADIVAGSGCQGGESLRLLNPAWLGLIGVTLTPLLGLLAREPRPLSAGKVGSSQPVPAGRRFLDSRR